MDINIKGDIDGIETKGRIMNEFTTLVVFHTSHSDRPKLERAKAINPEGFILKPFGDNVLLVAIGLALNKCSCRIRCRNKIPATIAIVNFLYRN